MVVNKINDIYQEVNLPGKILEKEEVVKTEVKSKTDTADISETGKILSSLGLTDEEKSLLTQSLKGISEQPDPLVKAHELNKLVNSLRELNGGERTEFLRAKAEQSKE